ncbi:hypothetical protein M2158_005756 [Streptomyces sp. SAI-144]|uniref:hypothetical protein n=1 Tax=Streptomyces sp. SAI-144 TaxID=2940544 RepID=UPI0024764080|nr:hypothetical protein [Streptomyces sp. SAI-144]MDH6437215.1 hypothetical protein [Streptomyces sp. SAI-144]
MGDYADWLADRTPAAVAERAPKRTHYPHLAQPEWFVSRVHEFLVRLMPVSTLSCPFAQLRIRTVLAADVS